MHLLSGTRGRVVLEPRGRKGAVGGAKASQHFSKCSGCQATQQIVAVLCVAHTISAPHHACACCPHIHAYLLPSFSHGPHFRSPSHASAFQHVTTCRACGSGAQWRPVISPFDCSVLSWRPIHPGQLKPTTLPLRRLAPDSCSVGLSPTLSLTFSPVLSPAPHSLSLSSLLLLSVPFPLRPTLSLSLSLPLAQKGGFGSFGVSLSPRGSNHPLQDRRGVVYPLGHDDWVSAPRAQIFLSYPPLCVIPRHAYLLSHGGVLSSV